MRIRAVLDEVNIEFKEEVVEYLPFTVPFWRKIGLSFARAFAGSLIVSVPAGVVLFVESGYSGGLGAVAGIGGAAVSAALTAGLRAVQANTTSLESPQVPVDK